MKKLNFLLHRNPFVLNSWCFFAAFGAYFCTYALRKPVFTGIFEGYSIWGFSLKSIYICTQVLGYMASKFIGIKIISELQSSKRIKLILVLVAIASLALLFFALIPAPFNLPFLLLNGLPLGMIWGVLFSFLEGRKFTEILGISLSANMIMTSGILKSMYLEIQSAQGYSDFFMPLVIAILTLPAFGLFIWMLSKIPPPSTQDTELKKARVPMSRANKHTVLKNYGLGITCLIITYAFITILRDFRDNFAIEIWQQLDSTHSTQIFTKTEMTIALFAMPILALFTVFKSNRLAFSWINLTMVVSLILILLANLLFKNHLLSPQLWMTFIGVGLYLPYLLIQITYFERLIAYLQIKGNAGFFVYLCDSLGYLGSVLLLIIREFNATKINFIETLLLISESAAYMGLVLILVQYLFFKRKRHQDFTLKNTIA